MPWPHHMNWVLTVAHIAYQQKNLHYLVFALYYDIRESQVKNQERGTTKGFDRCSSIHFFCRIILTRFMFSQACLPSIWLELSCVPLTSSKSHGVSCCGSMAGRPNVGGSWCCWSALHCEWQEVETKWCHRKWHGDRTCYQAYGGPLVNRRTPSSCGEFLLSSQA